MSTETSVSANFAVKPILISITMLKFVYLWFALKTTFCDCHSERRISGFERGRTNYKVIKIGKLPAVISESSGLARVSNKKTFWTHNDGGNTPELFEIDNTGKIVAVLKLPKLQNTDWEDMTQHPDGQLFIGDFGNNDNTRRDLAIYKIDPAQPDSPEKITFAYRDQTAFPPPAKLRNFDCEAMVYLNEKLYLFSKNQSSINKRVRLYEMPARAGSYEVAPKDSIFLKSMITGAALSPDTRTLALVSYGKVFLFDVIDDQINFKRPRQCIKVAKLQTEAIVFVNNTDFVVTNEQRGMYLVRRKK